MGRSQQSAVAAFLSKIDEPGFPCAGAKSALSKNAVQVFIAGDLRLPHRDEPVLHCLRQFASDNDTHALFVSMVVLFPATPMLDERAFEAALWQRLQALHELDREHHAWDPSVSSDPSSPDFSMSLGGRAFYVIGLHPGASRPARRFSDAALVFNLHSQFETLREDGRYEKLRATINGRDIDYAGSANPMLAVHGTDSEARQYSGRQVDAGWRCPFEVAPCSGSQSAH